MVVAGAIGIGIEALLGTRVPEWAHQALRSGHVRGLGALLVAEGLYQI